MHLASIDGTDDVSVIDESDPRSLINMVSPRFKEAIRDLYKNHPDLTEQSEKDLYRIVQPSFQLDELRLSFWVEFNRAMDTGSTMMMKNAYSCVMTGDLFHKMIRRPEVVAWIITVPRQHKISCEAKLNYLSNEIEEMVKTPWYKLDKKGNKLIDPKTANVFLKIYQLMENRVHGGAVQRLEQKTATISLGSRGGTDDELRQELEKLRSKAIDISPNEKDVSDISDE